jgi:[acyl-carrier-protein] S-malonyltransferase
MYQAGIARPGTMAAILGEVSRPIEEICAQATHEAGLVVPANYNSPGQLVLSGEEAGIERAMALCKEAGAKRTVRLNVSGAFHSPLMESASQGLVQALDSVSFADPRFAVYANVDGSAVTDARRARSLLLRQLANPVRWTDEVLAITTRYPDALYIEMGPGNVLAGLVKKIAPSVKTMTCGTAAEVAQLMELAAV